MDHPQDGRSRVPTNRYAPLGRHTAADPPAETDDPYAPLRSSQTFSAGRQSGFERPGTEERSRPTAGYYPAATPPQPAPRAGRTAGPATAERTNGNSGGTWASPYPEQRRGSAARADRTPTGHETDDNWDTMVFSLLPSRAAARTAETTSRSQFLDKAEHTQDADDATRTRTEARLARQVAAIASLAAGVVHVFAVSSHWQEWALAGAFFAATAGFQLIWGVLALLTGNLFIRVTGLLANLGVLAVWAVSRLYGLPFGPHAGVPEAFGTPDLISAAMEVAIVVGLLWSLLPRERHGVLSPGGYRAVLVLATVVLGALAIPGSMTALEHTHAHDTETAENEDDGHDHEHGADENADMESPADPETSAEPEATEPAEEDHTHAPGEDHG